MVNKQIKRVEREQNVIGLQCRLEIIIASGLYEKYFPKQVVCDSN